MSLITEQQIKLVLNIKKVSSSFTWSNYHPICQCVYQAYVQIPICKKLLLSGKLEFCHTKSVEEVWRCMHRCKCIKVYDEFSHEIELILILFFVERPSKL